MTEKADSIVINSISEDNGLKELSELKASHLCANFAYSSILVQTGAVTLYKNRILDDNLTFFPIYNNSEFFISPFQEQASVYYQSGSSYFYDVVFATNVNQIVLPQPFPTATRPFSDSNKYIFNNLSSKPIDIKLISTNSIITTLNPNSKITISISAGAWSVAAYSSADGVLENPNKPLQVIFENQNLEIDAYHPFKALWGGDGYSKGSSVIVSFISNAFLPDSNGVEKEGILLDSIPYAIVDASSNFKNVDTYTNNISAEDYTVFCFGRRGPKITLTDSDLYVLNDFYLYFSCSAANRVEFITLGQIWGQKFIDSKPTNPIYVERNKLDIGSLFEGRESRIDISNLKDVTMFPFYKETSSFYLPNLSTTPRWYSDETQTLGCGQDLVEGVFANRAVFNTYINPQFCYQPGYVFVAGLASKWGDRQIVWPRLINSLLALGIAITSITILGRRIGYTSGLLIALIFLSYEQAVIHFRWVYAHNAAALGFFICFACQCLGVTRKRSWQSGESKDAKYHT
jgi:hypothetical protein